MTSVKEIRSTFLNFFAREGHEVVASSPLVPRNDPTLMFTNSGMVQFKNVFTGLERRDTPRATTAQKCVRAGGKHNDLDNVGYTARHHTFFEMLGNFSFGDYFKDRAIELAWNLITRDFALPADRLTVTVFADDDEAFGLWKKIAGLPDDRIIRIATSDNFWRMGETGPCGPCSEIFFDHGDRIWGGPPGSAEADGDRFVEIWNLVFMQFEEQVGGGRVSLPRPSIDTGMGLERLAAVLQGVHDNFDIDLFKTLIAASVELTGVPAEGAQRSSHRVIVDHLRSASFLIADGVMPSNEGRGYVLRRIMRRAMRHAHILGAREPLLWRLVPTLVAEMGTAYPELVRASAVITETLRQEELRFRRTLERGLGLLDEASRSLQAGAVLDGETTFKLYDTYGFPLDLTQDALRARSISVDTDGFAHAMARQKAEARAAWVGSGDKAADQVWFSVKDEVGPTEFLGYAHEASEAVVVALVHDGQRITEADAGSDVMIIVNQTPFYGESGGQVGDAGWMTAENGVRVAILDTVKRAENLFVHVARIEAGTLKVGAAVALAVDHERRSAIRSNHSATHLLHEALRATLGDHVAQKGSLVSQERLRFDFSHPKPIDDAELEHIEDIANQVVAQNAPVVTRLLGVEEAIESGARALFGEKYGDEVRVVSMGMHTAQTGGAARAGGAFSVELCGGTHVERTGDIGLITVVSEAAVSSGVRRVEALTGATARRYFAEQDRRVREIAGVLRTAPAEVVSRVEGLVDERRRLERELAEAKKRLALAGGSVEAAVVTIGPVAYQARLLQGVSGKDLKGLVDEAKASLGSGVVAFCAVDEAGKVSLVVAVSGDLVDRISAVDLVRAGAVALGGKGGGGRPDMAQAGGADSSRAGAALDAVAERLKEAFAPVP